MSCQHELFDAAVMVNRLEDKKLFMADITINCQECHIPFRFVGLPAGIDLHGATVSIDQTEARLAIVPSEGNT